MSIGFSADEPVSAARFAFGGGGDACRRLCACRCGSELVSGPADAASGGPARDEEALVCGRAGGGGMVGGGATGGGGSAREEEAPVCGGSRGAVLDGDAVGDVREEAGDCGCGVEGGGVIGGAAAGRGRVPVRGDSGGAANGGGREEGGGSGGSASGGRTSGGGSAARGVPGGGGSGLPTANGRSEWSPCADSSARHATLEAASAAAAASASAAVFGEVNDSGGRDASAPKRRGGAIGGRGELADAAPESGGVKLADGGPDDVDVRGWLLGGCGARALRSLEACRRHRRSIGGASRLVLGDDYLRSLVLGSRRKLAADDLSDGECRVVGTNAYAAKLDGLAPSRTRQRQRRNVLATLDNRELGKRAKHLGKPREVRSQQIANRVATGCRDLSSKLRVDSANSEFRLVATSKYLASCSKIAESERGGAEDRGSIAGVHLRRYRIRGDCGDRNRVRRRGFARDRDGRSTRVEVRSRSQRRTSRGDEVGEPNPRWLNEVNNSSRDASA